MNSESSSTSTKLKIRPPDWMRKRGVPLDLAKKMCDPFWYIPRMKIVDKQGRRRPIKNLHPAQKEILHAMVNNRNVCILKARQVGASTIVTAFFCWLALIQDEKYSVFTLTDSGDTVSSMNDMYRRFLEFTPERWCPELVVNNSKGLEIGHNGAALRQKMAGGKGQGRSFTYQGIHCTEMGFWPRSSSAHAGKTDTDRKTWQAALASLAQCQTTRIVCESTAAGSGGIFHDTCRLAQRSDEWAFIFYPWYAQAEYWRTPPPHWERTEEEHQLAIKHGLNDGQLAWRRYKIVDEQYGLRGFLQEFPETPEDPFLVSGGMWFDTLALSNRKKHIITTSEAKKELLIMKPYQPQYKYFMGIDTSGGTGGDYAAFQIIRDDMVQVARWASNTRSPREQAEHAAMLGMKYGKCPILCEDNKYGKTILHLLENDCGYGNLWTSSKGKWWHTDRTNKRMIYTELRDAVDNGHMSILDPLTLEELFYIREQDDGDIRADGTGHDDLTDALAFALWCGRNHFHKRYIKEEIQTDRFKAFKNVMR